MNHFFMYVTVLIGLVLMNSGLVLNKVLKYVRKSIRKCRGEEDDAMVSKSEAS